MALRRTSATLSDDADFASFSCWDGDGSTPWIEEAENYVRGEVLRRAEHKLAFRDPDEGGLIAVAAFDKATVVVPRVDPVERQVWHLQVVAIELEYQRQQLCLEVFAGTFAAMREIDPARNMVRAYVHKEHRASLKACACVGLEPYLPLDEHYTILLGLVPDPST